MDRYVKTFEMTVEEPNAVRLDAVITKITTKDGISRERVKKAVADGYCRLDGVICSDSAKKVHAGQHIRCDIPDGETNLLPSETPIEVLYEDPDLAVIVKPAGLTVHPCPSCDEETLTHRLLHRFPQLAALGGERPGIVHRLDKDTGGLMLIALSDRGYSALTEMFAKRQIHKTYAALVRGIVPLHGVCEQYIGRHPTIKTKMAAFNDDKTGARPARSEYFRLYCAPKGLFSLVLVKIFTGRTHQIRVHMATLKHPLLGDKVYGSMEPLIRTDGVKIPDPAPRQMLHAWKLEFTHPVTQQPMSFHTPPPTDFLTVQRILSKKMRRLIITGLPACGKSMVLQYLSSHMPVWSADAVVAAMYKPGGAVASELQRRYGDRFTDEFGAVNKKALFRAMVYDNLRRELERLIHPLAANDLERFFRECEEHGEKCAAAEVPLWFESEDMQRLCTTKSCTTPVASTISNLSDPASVISKIPGFSDELQELLDPQTLHNLSAPEYTVIGVDCPDELRHQRLTNNRNWSPETIAVIDSWQWSAKKKMAACDYVIQNTGTPEQLREQAEKILSF